MNEKYEQPQVEVVEIEVEGAILDGSIDPVIDG